VKVKEIKVQIKILLLQEAVRVLVEVKNKTFIEAKAYNLFLIIITSRKVKLIEILLFFNNLMQE
jgi:hypothetical protein